MSQISQADIFIKTLAEMLEVERACRLTELFGRHKTQANWFGSWLKGEFDTAGLPTGTSRTELRSEPAVIAGSVISGSLGSIKSKISRLARQYEIQE